MSMHEAIRSLRGKIPWLSDPEDEVPVVPVVPPPLEAAESLILLAKAPGRVERTSETWQAVARWAATELIVAQTGLETATGERADALRSRVKTLRDVLAIDERTALKAVVADQGPYVP